MPILGLFHSCSLFGVVYRSADNNQRAKIWCLYEISGRRVTHDNTSNSFSFAHTKNINKMEDPLSAVHDRPHRYLLDSDSEDEEGQGIYSPSTSGPSRLSNLHITSPASAPVTISSPGPFEEVILGIGQAGKYLSRKFGADGKVEVKVGEEVVGTGGVVGGRLVLGVDDEQVEDLHSLATSLLNVKTKYWYVPLSKSTR